jgi:hypothetical protein
VPGDYTVIFHPVFDLESGLIFWPVFSPVEVTVPTGGSEAVAGSYDAVQRMFIKASGQTNPTGIDLNAQDLVDMAGPTGSLLLKVREIEGCGGKRMRVIGSEWYDPE